MASPIHTGICARSAARSAALVVSVVLALVGSASVGRAQSRAARSQALPVTPGTWISIPYADALMTKRSAMAAAEVSPPLAVDVSERGGATVMSVTSFHETWQLRVVSSEAGRLVLSSAEAGDERSDRRIAVSSAMADDRGVAEWQTTLSMESEGKTPQRYRYLPASAFDWAARVLIAGDYTDAQGKPWEFNVDRATTPEGRFTYRVALDPSEAGCDYFETPDAKAVGGQRRTGFAWNGKSLELYRIVYDSDGPPIACDARPFAVLTRRAPAPAAANASGACTLTRLPIVQKTKADWEHLESRAKTFTLAHWNFGAKPTPTFFSEKGILVTHADGSTCEFDPTIYGADLWVSRDESTLAVVSSSGSSAEFLVVDVKTCAVRVRLDVSGPDVVVAGNLVTHPGDCEMSDTTRGTCWPAKVWHLDPHCEPVEIPSASAALTRERFGVGFWMRSEIDRPFTPMATWIGVTPASR